ncbi:MAG TPA: thiamine pyrophosphate-binding protein [Paraburkholderia sp.]|jgi:acetolactate synthase-1/2/3 large subunit
MKHETSALTGARLLVDTLRSERVDTLYTVPGESFLAALDALYDVRDEIDVIVCRHESGAANMAEAYGKLTNRPGICFVTRGPGASNACIGVHTARQDSTPMIVFVGQVARDTIEREAWQEIDYRQMFGHSAKWVTQIDSAARIPELVGRAFHVATSGRPGPVVIALPEDMLVETVASGQIKPLVPARPVVMQPAPEHMAELEKLLGEARKPVVLLGGGAWDREACADLQTFASRFDLPVACTFRRQDLFDNRDPHYAGEAGLGMDPALFERLRAADLVLAIGPRLGETSTRGYELFDVPTPAMRLVHVHRDVGELGRVYRAHLAINAGMREFAAALAKLPAPAAPAWRDWTRAAHEDYEARRVPPAFVGDLDLGAVVAHVDQALPENAIVSNGAGNYTLWVQRFFRYRGWRTQLAPTSGAMGYGLPAAIAAALREPERPTVCFAGDGCFLMTGQELATAVQYDARVIVIVVDNGMYGSIRMHQHRHYPGRVIGTELRSPDFVGLARAYGAYAEQVEQTADFPAAFQRAREAGKPALLLLRTSPNVLTPNMVVPADAS